MFCLFLTLQGGQDGGKAQTEAPPSEQAEHQTRQCQPPPPEGSVHPASVLESSSGEVSEAADSSQAEQSRTQLYGEMSTDSLYSRLKEVDEASARKIHPHDKRKIFRYVQG